MEVMSTHNLEEIYPYCHACLVGERWDTLRKTLKEDDPAENVAVTFAQSPVESNIPPYLPELATLEWAVHRVKTAKVKFPKKVKSFVVNPTLELLHLSWHFSELIQGSEFDASKEPSPGDEWMLIWREPNTNNVHIEPASKEELLILKIVIEKLSPDDVVDGGELTHDDIDRLIWQVARRGVLLKPESRLQRDPSVFSKELTIPKKYLVAKTFTLEWHIVDSLPAPDEGIKILDELKSFCRDRYVRGHVSFSGGDLFPFPNFSKLYQETAARGFATSVLANPIPRKQLEEITKIQRPGTFQVSLEGLREHNDSVRGEGSYDRTIEFLHLLKDFNIPSIVMLTLTRNNIEQVLPLAEELKEHTGHFTFNRLSQAGEGERLSLPTPEQYRRFLEQYVEAADTNPIIGFSDNLINIVLHNKGYKPFDGCTGFGCGAAFNSVAIFPDGEVHACHKFPSSIGNILQDGLAHIYDSDTAKKYRRGANACIGCKMRHLCGGCLSVSSGLGLDPLTYGDPFCFLHQSR